MSPHEFQFAVTLSDETSAAHPLKADAMLGDLIAAVLGYVGLVPEAVTELTAATRGALAAGGAGGARRANLVFRAHQGELAITIGYDGGAEWRTTRPLP